MLKHLSLTGITVLVTRPIGQAEALAQVIENKGAKAVVCSTLEIVEPSDLSVFESLPAEAEAADIVVFITANAVHATLSHDSIYKECIIGMGPGTQAALKEHDLECTIPAAPYTTEDLLALPELQHIDGKKILIIGGEGGRATLKNELCEKGATVSKRAVYARRCPDLNLTSQLPEWETTLDIIISTSGESLQNLVKLVPEHHHPWLFGMPVIVISERVANIARELGFGKPIIAKSSTNSDILQTLQSWYATRQR